MLVRLCVRTASTLNTRVRHCRKVDESAAERLLVLALEQLRAGELPQLLANEVWNFPNLLIQFQRPALMRVALELDIYGIAVAQLRAIGRPADWLVRWRTSLEQLQPTAGSLRYTL